MSNKANVGKGARNLTMKTPAAFYPQLHSSYSFSLVSQRIAQNRQHPLHPQVIQKYDNRDDPFWWTFIASLKNLGNKSTLRNWVVRKARISFEKALLESGYDKTGRWVHANKEGQDLKGMADLILSPAAITMNGEELKAQSLLFIKLVEKQEVKRLAKTGTGKAQRPRESKHRGLGLGAR